MQWLLIVFVDCKLKSWSMIQDCGFIYIGFKSFQPPYVVIDKDNGRFAFFF
ncbi:hypothetical protein [Bacillus wiedmannii]|uniref:hypothetical protein n=1 Tax=Bacillus wiedmannii TaxID=1890302 RepID=UPI001485B8E7|nr:hypothetical protein [Bacillus wiedmannii]